MKNDYQIEKLRKELIDFKKFLDEVPENGYIITEYIIDKYIESINDNEESS